MDQNQNNFRPDYHTKLSSAKKLLYSGIKKSARTVLSTMGPFGHNVFINANARGATCTKDGVTVARTIVWNNPMENLGNVIFIDAAGKTEKEAGDGTTTCCCLISAMIDQWRKLERLSMFSSPLNVFKVEQGIRKAIEDIDNLYLKPLKIDCTKELLKGVATIAANNNVELGSKISEIVWRGGKYGQVVTKKSGDHKTFTDFIGGYKLSTSLIDEKFFRGEKELTLHNPYVVLSNDRVDDYEKIQTIIRTWNDHNKINLSIKKPLQPLVFIAEDVEGSALSTILENFNRGKLIYCIKAPMGGDRRVALMEDLKIVTGAKVIFDELRGFGLSTGITGLGQLGKADTITIKKSGTSIISKETEKVRLERLKEVESVLNDPDSEELISNSSDYRKFLENRLASLDAGIGVIYVGADTDIEFQQKIRLVDDAILACQTAFKDGVLPGAGSSLYSIKNPLTINEDRFFKLGYNLVYASLKEPANVIFANAGVKKFSLNNWIIQDFSGKTINAKEHNIVDPYGVTISALRNAASAVIQIITSKHLLTYYDN